MRPFIVHREKLVQYIDALGYNYKCNFARLACNCSEVVLIGTHRLRMRIKAFLSESGSGLAKSRSDPGTVESESDDPGNAESG